MIYDGLLSVKVKTNVACRQHFKCNAMQCNAMIIEQIFNWNKVLMDYDLLYFSHARTTKHNSALFLNKIDTEENYLLSRWNKIDTGTLIAVYHNVFCNI